MQTYTSIDYSPELKITNVENLPRGTGCKYLLCLFVGTVNGRDLPLIAKSWHRKYPYSRRKSGMVVVNF